MCRSSKITINLGYVDLWARPPSRRSPRQSKRSAKSTLRPPDKDRRPITTLKLRSGPGHQPGGTL